MTGKNRIGRSGAFRRKRNALVKQIIKPYQVPNVSVYKNTVQSEDNAIVCNGTETTSAIVSEAESVNVAEVEIVNVAEAESFIETNIDNSNENEIKSRNFPFDQTKFKSALASWAVDNGIKHCHLRGLLRIWNQYVPLPALPIDPRTFLETPRNISINENYWHRGLKSALQMMLGKCVNIPDNLSLKINTDGITISKSSTMECWPILVEIAELPKISP